MVYTKEIQKHIAAVKQSIATLEDNLVVRRERLEQAQTQLADAIAAENKKPELENGDYGKRFQAGWVYIGGKVLWEDGGVSELHVTDFTEYRKGNFIREMEERQA